MEKITEDDLASVPHAQPQPTGVLLLPTCWRTLMVTTGDWGALGPLSPAGDGLECSPGDVPFPLIGRNLSNP